MANFDMFVGREQELSLIATLAGERAVPHLVLIDGYGGIGKTFLLRRVRQQYQQEADFAVVYFDIADLQGGLLSEPLQVAEGIGWEHFPHFAAKVKALSEGEYNNLSIRLPELEADAQRVFFEELVTWVGPRHLIRLSDSLDTTLAGQLQAQSLARYAEYFPGFIAVVTGRKAFEFRPQFEETFGAENITAIALESFNHEEADKFFTNVDRSVLIPFDIRAKLHLLTEGRPILLSLTVDWLARDVPLPEITEYSLEYFENLTERRLQELRERFEFELVDQVRRLKGPLDRAVLYMAHVNRRSDAQILSILLDIPPFEARVLMEQLAELSFVKFNATTGSCVLHDEMRNLVNRHVWPYVDPTGDIRRKLLRKVIAGYYEVQIQNLTHQIKLDLTLPLSANNASKVSATEWQFWRLEAECLHYHLMISEEEGRIYFDDHFLEAQRNNHLLRIQFLINEMEISGHSDIHDRVILRKAEVLRLSGQVDEAQKICETALNKEDLSLDNCISAYVTLGWIAASVDPEKAKKHFEAALYLAQEKEDKRLIGVLHNNLGRLYRLTSQLKQAVQHYQLAISYSKQAENWPVVTSATNNMAYVYHLQGNLARADAMCRVALAQRKKLGLERDIAFSYLTKAHIDQDKGNLESAERYTRLALRGFDRVGEVRGLIMAYASLANIHRYLEHYEESEAYLEQGVSLALKIRNEPLLASLFGSYGSEQRSYAISLRSLGNTHNQRLIESLFLGSIEYLQKSLELAGKYGDQWLLARGQLELAMTYLYYGNHTDEEIIKLIDLVWETASRLEDKLLLGYVQEVRGIMALHNRDYTRAARQLVLASRLIAQRPGREANEFFDRLSEIILDTELSPDAVIALSRTILESLGEPPESPYLQSLQSLCQQTVDLQLI